VVRFTVAALLILAVLPGRALAATLVFTRDVAITVTPGQRVAIGFCNTGETDRAARVVFTDFALLRNAKPVATADYITAKPAPATVSPGTCGTLEVGVGKGLDPGAYRGEIVLAGQGQLVRRPVIISVPIAATSQPPTPALTPVSLSARRAALQWTPPFVRRRTSYLLGDATIPFGPYTPRATLDGVRAGKVLAIVQNGASRARLVATGPGVVDSAGFLSVPVRLDGGGHAGTYKGVIALGTGAGATKLDVTVQVGDSIGLAIAAIVIAALLTAFVILVTQRFWPSARMRWFRWRLPQRYTRARKKLVEQLKGAGIEAPQIDEASVREYALQIKHAYKRSLSQAKDADAEGAGFAAVRDLLRAAIDDVTAIRSPAGLAQALKDLRQARQANRREDAPAFDESAMRLLVGGPLKVGDAVKRSADARTFATMFVSFDAFVERLKRYEGWVGAIQERVAMGLAAVEQEGVLDWRILRRDFSALWAAAAKNTELGHVLRDSKDVEAFANGVFEKQLDSVEQGLAQFGDLAWAPEPPVENARFGGMVFLEAKFDRLGEFAAGALSKARQVISSGPVAGAGAAFGFASIGLAAVLLTILLALGTAIATGLSTTYGDAFGSLKDYLTIIGLGGASTTAAKALVDGISNLKKPLV
jgi:hypothetical protein